MSAKIKLKELSKDELIDIILNKDKEVEKLKKKKKSYRRKIKKL